MPRYWYDDVKLTHFIKKLGLSQEKITIPMPGMPLSRVKFTKCHGKLSFPREKLEMHTGNYHSQWNGTISRGKLQLPVRKRSNPVGIFKLPEGNFHFPGEMSISLGKFIGNSTLPVMIFRFPVGNAWFPCNSQGDSWFPVGSGPLPVGISWVFFVRENHTD